MKRLQRWLKDCQRSGSHHFLTLWLLLALFSPDRLYQISEFRSDAKWLNGWIINFKHGLYKLIAPLTVNWCGLRSMLWLISRAYFWIENIFYFNGIGNDSDDILYHQSEFLDGTMYVITSYVIMWFAGVWLFNHDQHTDHIKKDSPCYKIELFNCIVIINNFEFWYFQLCYNLSFV